MPDTDTTANEAERRFWQAVDRGVTENAAATSANISQLWHIAVGRMVKGYLAEIEQADTFALVWTNGEAARHDLWKMIELGHQEFTGANLPCPLCTGPAPIHDASSGKTDRWLQLH